MTSDTPHISVLEGPVLELLAPKAGGLYCDGTMGAGGHTRAILRACAPDGRVIGIDRDSVAHQIAQQRIGSEWPRVTPVHGAFGDIKAIFSAHHIDTVDGLLLDLGVSSMQLDNGERGFSFSKAGPIDMRMDPSQGETARELIRRLPPDDLARVIRDYGEERFAGRIARRLKENIDQLETTDDLARVVADSIPGKAKRNMRIHPATRTFQGLRIAVNRELEQLENFLRDFPDLLRPGGRCAIISFHSLEDRMVKRRFRDLAQTSSLPPDLARAAGERVHPICTRVTRKAVVATAEEIAANPRARSARLRVCERAPS